MNTPAPADQFGGDVATRLGFRPELIVQEFGYDNDVDNDVRFAIEDTCGAELEDEDYTGTADAALLWWRSDDGDLTDALVDMVSVIEEDGFVVLLTPRSGSAGAVDAAEVDEAAVTAGLHASGTFSAPGWRATRLVAPKKGKR